MPSRLKWSSKRWCWGRRWAGAGAGCWGKGHSTAWRRSTGSCHGNKCLGPERGSYRPYPGRFVQVVHHCSWYLQGKIRRVGMCTPHSILIRVRSLHSYHVLKNHQWHRCSSLSREVELGWNQTLPTHCRSGKACSKCHLLVTQPPCPWLQLEASIFCCFTEVRGSNSFQECCSWTFPSAPSTKAKSA